MTEPQLTVCSVYNRHDRGYLLLNLQQIARMNPDGGWSRLIFNNGPEEISIADDLEPITGETTLLNGPPQDAFNIPGGGSYRHADSLNKTLANVKTRYALLTDPDLFCVRPGWVSEVIAHMQERGLAFFGVPHHPRWYSKFRYFPSVNWMVIDLDQVDREAFDFTPDLPIKENRVDGRRKPWLKRTAPKIAAGLAVATLLDRRGSIGTSHDVGYLVRNHFVRTGLGVECVASVYRPERDYLGPPYGTRPYGRMMQRMLPDRLCYIPKREGYTSATGYRERSYPDLSALGWEEFLWKDAPFAFHLRSQRYWEGGSQADEVRDILEQIRDVQARA